MFIVFMFCNKTLLILKELAKCNILTMETKNKLLAYFKSKYIFSEVLSFAFYCHEAF